MNQKRYNQMRSINRGQEQGLHQVLQASGAGQLPQGQGQGQGQGGNQGHQTVRRKMTYTRTELLCRGLPTTQIPRRSPRSRGTYTQGNTLQSPAAPHTPLSAGHGNATSMKQRSYLPRVARLQSPNRNLTRMRTEIEAKPEPGQVKKTPRVPNTPQASHCSIPLPVPGVGHHTMRIEGSGIPILDRSRNRECSNLMPRESAKNKDLVEMVGITDTSSRSSSPANLSRMGKPISLPGDPQNKSFVYLCKPVKKVKELLTARQLRHSCENLEPNRFGEPNGAGKGKLLPLQKTNSEELLHSKALEQGLELSSITEMSLTPTSSFDNQLQLPQLQHKHQEKQKQKHHPADDSQERLMHQLTELRQRQLYLCHKEQRQKEMDMVCQNLPTLQHEIRLLQELNVKLESTLRGSNAVKQRCNNIAYDLERQSSTVFYTPRCGPMLFIEMPLIQVGFIRVEQRARITRRVHVVAVAHSLAVVREFRIETKTLNELKASDETQCFYLPQPKVVEQHTLVDTSSSESNPPPLQCTNLRMLRENPDVLIQQLRRGGGGAGGSYSLLDHDMFMFINSLSKKTDEAFLYSSLAVGIPSKEHSPLASEYHHHQQQLQRVQNQLQEVTACKQVNSTTQTEEEDAVQEKDQEDSEEKDLEESQERDQEESQEMEQEVSQEKDHVQDQDRDLAALDAPPTTLVQTQTKPKRRLRKARQQFGTTRNSRIVKRSPIQRNVEPKVRLKLFKTVLVGLVQVAVFLVLIMAFMYPDATCSIMTKER
ncbi:hypothetical protein KR038_005365 [Drosophila bunnanda]|nr:hypothetical protein KR038_005365 [Drosophila bunnanda]